MVGAALQREGGGGRRVLAGRGQACRAMRARGGNNARDCGSEWGRSACSNGGLEVTVDYILCIERLLLPRGKHEADFPALWPGLELRL